MHVENNYACLGITCEDVGELQNSAGVFTGMEACVNYTPKFPELCPVTTTEAPVTTEAPATEAPATAAPTTAAATVTTAAPTEPAVVETEQLDSMAYPFAALSGIVFLVTA